MTRTSALETSGEQALPPGLLGPVLRISPAGTVVLRPVYAAAGEAIVDWAWVYLNPAAQRLLALPECPAASLLALFPTAEAAGVVGFCREAFLSGREERYPYEGLGSYYPLVAQRHADVLVVSFAGTANPPRPTGGEARRRVQEDATAEVQHAELRRLFEQAPLALAVYQGPQHVVVLANEATAAIWGRPLAQVLHRPVFEVLPEAATQDVVGIFDHVLATGQRYVAHEQATRINRHSRQDTVYWNFVFEPQRAADGRVTGIITVGTEVTELVRTRQQVQALNQGLAAANQQLRTAHEQVLAHNAELELIQEQLRQLNAELEARVSHRTREAHAARAETEQARLRLEQLFMEAPAAICVYGGPELVYELVNPPYQELFGTRPLLGLPLAEALPEIVGHAAWHALHRVYETGVAHAKVAERVPVARPDGQGLHDRYFTFRYHPRTDEQGRVNGVLVFAFEVTEQVLAIRQAQQLNDQLNETNRQLTRTNVDLDNFIYTASHDLKAPISNIEGLLLALEQELPAAGRVGDVPHMLTLMREATERVQRTILHLTDVSRLQKEHSPASESVSLAAVIEAVRLDLLPLIKQTRARVEVHVPADLTLTLAEKNLRSVVYNLLSNALKYRHPERVPHVRIGWQLRADAQLLEVQDNGLGLDLSQGAERLFAMFQRLHTHVEGTGIGLYMVKKIVENAGGRIEVESQLGLGSTFRVYFPPQRPADNV